MTIFAQPNPWTGVHAGARRPGWFTRLREWWIVRMEARAQIDAPEPVKPTADRPHPQTQPTNRIHPPFAMHPAPMSHVLDRMQHLLIDLRHDPSMTAIRAAQALHDLNAELSHYARQEHDQARRMERNQHAAEAQATLLAEATTRGAGDEAAEQAKAGIVGRAAHVADPEQTGVMPPITDDTPDPRTAALPTEVGDGDVPESDSPVHTPGDPMPLPTQDFVAGGLSAGSELANRAMGLRPPQAPQQDGAAA